MSTTLTPLHPASIHIEGIVAIHEGTLLCQIEGCDIYWMDRTNTFFFVILGPGASDWALMGTPEGGWHPVRQHVPGAVDTYCRAYFALTR